MSRCVASFQAKSTRVHKPPVLGCVHRIDRGGRYESGICAERRAAVGGITLLSRTYPLIGGLLHPADSDTGDTMMMSLYFALGIFLLIAVRNSSAHRSLIAFAAWSSFAHALTMSTQGFEMQSQRSGFLIGSAVLVVIGPALLALVPKRPTLKGILRAGA